MPKQVDTTRECALTRTSMPVADLIRFALGPDGMVVPDVDGKAPGRGVWICLNHADVEQAVAKNVFSKSLKQKVKVPADLAKMTRTRLEQRLAGALGLARKAGQLQTGATRVKSSIDSGTVVALLTASDAAPDGRRKMAASLRASGQAERVPHLDIMTADQLGLALGLENVIHASLSGGAAAKSALARAKRLARYNAQRDERDANI